MFYYTQEIVVAFWCPMRFHLYPLDVQVCQFRVASFAFNRTMITFKVQKLYYDETAENTILDYTVQVLEVGGENHDDMRDNIGNFSIAAFQLRLERHSLKYFFNYYLPSGLFVIMSWVSDLAFTSAFIQMLSKLMLTSLSILFGEPIAHLNELIGSMSL